MTYYVYHILGVKIGVTNNIENRVIKVQGYEYGEFEILAESNDIEYISKLEVELQKKYNYEVEEILYCDLIKMNRE